MGAADEELSSAYGRSPYAIGDDAFVKGVEDEMKGTSTDRRTRSDLAAPEMRQGEMNELLRLRDSGVSP